MYMYNQFNYGLMKSHNVIGLLRVPNVSRNLVPEDRHSKCQGCSSSL